MTGTPKNKTKNNKQCDSHFRRKTAKVWWPYRDPDIRIRAPCMTWLMLPHPWNWDIPGNRKEIEVNGRKMRVDAPFVSGSHFGLKTLGWKLAWNYTVIFLDCWVCLLRGLFAKIDLFPSKYTNKHDLTIDWRHKNVKRSACAVCQLSVKKMKEPSKGALSSVDRKHLICPFHSRFLFYLQKIPKNVITVVK